jgi:hypothetical protein
MYFEHEFTHIVRCDQFMTSTANLNRPGAAIFTTGFLYLNSSVRQLPYIYINSLI